MARPGLTRPRLPLQVQELVVPSVGVPTPESDLIRAHVSGWRAVNDGGWTNETIHRSASLVDGRPAGGLVMPHPMRVVMG